MKTLGNNFIFLLDYTQFTLCALFAFSQRKIPLDIPNIEKSGKRGQIQPKYILSIFLASGLTEYFTNGLRFNDRFQLLINNEVDHTF